MSWGVLEHLESMESALATMHAYLRSGGRAVAHFAASRSIFALLNRVVPHELGAVIMERLLDRKPETKFEAHYDRCLYSHFLPLLGIFSKHRVIAHFRGARYFNFSRPRRRST